MLISHRYKFICINIPKTGSGTRENAFKAYFDLWFLNEKFKTKISNPRHSPAYLAKQEFLENGWAWDDYFKFTFVRNPWYRYISFYNMWINNGATRKDFNSWLGHDSFLGSDYQSFYYLENNELILDKIYMYEDLENSISEICNTVGIKESLLPLHNPGNVPMGGTKYDLSKYYTNQNINGMVKSLEYDVINRMGYIMPE